MYTNDESKPHWIYSFEIIPTTDIRKYLVSTINAQHNTRSEVRDIIIYHEQTE